MNQTYVVTIKPEHGNAERYRVVCPALSGAVVADDRVERGCGLRRGIDVAARCVADTLVLYGDAGRKITPPVVKTLNKSKRLQVYLVTWGNEL